jgi:Tol biopolymer transport system component
MSRAGMTGGKRLLLVMGVLAGCSGATGAAVGSFGPPSDDGGVPFVGFAEGGLSPSLSLDGGGGALQTVQPIQPSGPVTDFPTPVLDGTAPTNSATLFGPTTQGATSGGPCLVEPENNALYPQNWLRPRFRWTAANGENLFELRLHVANQLSDLVVYTTNMSWTMPKTMWDALRAHSPTEAMTITVRGGSQAGGALQGEALGSQTPMGIAPVQATGAIVYWTTNDVATGGSVLKGFSPGDETVETVLTPAQYTQGQQTTSQCIGCHASTPDGEFAAFTTTTTSQAQWNGGVALIDQEAGTVGAAPTFMSMAGAEALARWNVGGITFSPAHWATGDHRAIVSYDNDNNTSDIVLSWVDLEATTPSTASGTLARNGDSQLAGAPAWSHDGNTVAYVSTNRVCTGRLGNCTPNYDIPSDQGSLADIYTVPYAAGAGGTATGLKGASDPTLQEYYPAFSPDDQLIAFNRIADNLNLYNQPAAELFVISADGGTASRLSANDPPQCTGQTSPGLNNVWPKWGPAALVANGNTFYWLIFSSKRYDGQTEQLYMSTVVQQADGTLQTYGAVYLWNQPPTENNHTPAWDKFKVAPQPPPQ